MSKFQKAIDRLARKPKDFTWKELQTIMNHFGYEEFSGSGSIRKFFNTKTKVSVHLHQPHSAPTIKRYALEIIIDHLNEQGLL